MFSHNFIDTASKVSVNLSTIYLLHFFSRAKKFVSFFKKIINIIFSHAITNIVHYIIFTLKFKKIAA